MAERLFVGALPVLAIAEDNCLQPFNVAVCVSLNDALSPCRNRPRLFLYGGSNGKTHRLPARRTALTVVFLRAAAESRTCIACFLFAPMKAGQMT